MANHCAAALLLILSLLMVVALSSADTTVIILPPAALAGTNNADAHGLDAAVTAGADTECDTCEKPKTPEPPCSDCEEPKLPPPPPCNSCEEPKEAELTCNKAHVVRDGETCDSVVQCAGLGQDDFQRFNPNLCCEKLFVGQWLCLDATCDA